MDNQTVGIIGAGHVGSHVAMSLVIQGICRRVMLIDTDEKKARAQADDLMDGLCHLPRPVDEKRVMPCSALLTGQYGQEGVFASTLCVMGRDRAEEVWQLPLNQEEEEALVRSCEIIRRFVKEH